MAGRVTSLDGSRRGSHSTVFAALLLLPVLWAAEYQPPKNPGPLVKRVSLIRLIGSPGDFADVLVLTYGFASADSGIPVLYVSEEDKRRGLLANGIMLHLTAASKPAEATWNNQYVSVQGRFQPIPEGGPIDPTSGRLTEVHNLFPIGVPRAPETGAPPASR